MSLIFLVPSQASLLNQLASMIKIYLVFLRFFCPNQTNIWKKYLEVRVDTVGNFFSKLMKVTLHAIAEKKK